MPGLHVFSAPNWLRCDLGDCGPLSERYARRLPLQQYVERAGARRTMVWPTSPMWAFSSAIAKLSTSALLRLSWLLRMNWYSCNTRRGREAASPQTDRKQQAGCPRAASATHAARLASQGKHTPQAHRIVGQLASHVRLRHRDQACSSCEAAGQVPASKVTVRAGARSSAKRLPGYQTPHPMTPAVLHRAVPWPQGSLPQGQVHLTAAVIGVNKCGRQQCEWDMPWCQFMAAASLQSQVPPHHQHSHWERVQDGHCERDAQHRRDEERLAGGHRGRHLQLISRAAAASQALKECK